MALPVPQEKKNIFAENLKRLLLYNQMEQRDLAERMKVSTSIVNYWVNAQSYPRTKMMGNIAKILGVQIEDLTTVYTGQTKRASEDEMMLEMLSKLDAEEHEAIRILIESLVMKK